MILRSVEDPFYKIAGGALTVTQALIRVIHVNSNENLPPFGNLISSIYEAVITKLKMSDIDQVFYQIV